MDKIIPNEGSRIIISTMSKNSIFIEQDRDVIHLKCNTLPALISALQEIQKEVTDEKN